MNFRITLSISTKDAAGILTGIALNLQIWEVLSHLFLNMLKSLPFETRKPSFDCTSPYLSPALHNQTLPPLPTTPRGLTATSHSACPSNLDLFLGSSRFTERHSHPPRCPSQQPAYRPGQLSHAHSHAIITNAQFYY